MPFSINEIVTMLDHAFDVSSYVGKDTSFVKRISDYFDYDTVVRLEHGFIDNCNGLMICGSESIERIYGSAFLSNDALVEILNLNPKNSFLIVHHPLDIESGIEGVPCSVGYRAASNNLLLSYIAKGGNIYSLHLPLDLNSYAVNTHLCLIESLCLKHTQRSALLRIADHEYGYVIDVEPISMQKVLHNIKELSPDCVHYGAIRNNESVERIGLLAGIISSIDQIEQIDSKNCDLCICGDLFIRDGSERFMALEKAVSKCVTSFICLSHNISEYQVFDYGLFPLMKWTFPTLEYHGLLASQFK